MNTEKHTSQSSTTKLFKIGLKAIMSIALLVHITSSIIAAEAVESKSALETDPKGWVDIMPAADISDWNRVSIPPGKKLGRAQWHVDADKKILVCDGDGGHDMILTKKTYGDAIFHFEFRYTKIEGKKGYNSGAYIRNSKEGRIWHQAQFGSSSGGFLFGVSKGNNNNNKFFMAKSKVKNRITPAGQWNTMEITAKGKTISLWVNGAVTCSISNCNITEGHIGLEGEGYRVEFRNLKVKELK